MPQSSQPLPYTASPGRLALADLLLWIRITFVWPPLDGIPSIILPLLPFRSGALDELYPTPKNLWSVILQLIFTTFQAIFLLSLPISAVFGINILYPFIPPPLSAYVPIYILSIVVFVLTNKYLSILLLNGTNRNFLSHAPLSEADRTAHQDERWLFINGVAGSAHWMQSNLDRLSLGFRREIEGIHNQTRGIFFDLIECILERTFSYPTPSTRMVYARLLDTISNPKFTKIVVILHSQGAIEGGLALDWLFATVPAEQLARVEVYTFGSAANHFNNPVAVGTNSLGQRIDLPSDSMSTQGQSGRVLRHIEHYANSGDYVSKLGILHFRPLPSSMLPLGVVTRRPIRLRNKGMYPNDQTTNQTLENRYVGRLFIRHATGHQLNGNYLDNFFTMNPQLTEVLENNPFMDGDVDQMVLQQADIVVVDGMQVSVDGKGNISLEPKRGRAGIVAAQEATKVKSVSRLWAYRNGMSPED